MYDKNLYKQTSRFYAIMTDLLSLHFAFIAACRIHIGTSNPYDIVLYRNIINLLSLADLLLLHFVVSNTDIHNRGYLSELIIQIRQNIIIFLPGMFFLLIKNDVAFRKETFVLIFFLYGVFNYIFRMIWKLASAERTGASEIKS